LAEVNRDQGHLADALRLARKAMTAAERIGDERDQAMALLVLASIRQANGDHQDALALCEAVLSIARRREWVTIQIQAEIGAAAAYLLLDRADESLAWAERARRRAQDTGHQVPAGQAATIQADALVACGEFEEAAIAANVAQDIQRETGHRLGEAQALLSLANAQTSLGQTHLAMAHAEKARTLLTELGIQTGGLAHHVP
jgi:tetratricopeptide (TPR) repeat protein